MSEEPTSTDIQEQQVPEASRRPRWGIITSIGVMLAVIGAALVYLFYQPMYEASAWIQIEDTRPYIAFPDSGSSKGFVDTQVQLIRSPLVLGPVLGQPEIGRIRELQEQKDLVSWLQEQIQVEQVGKSELFKISYAGPDPEDSARVVNTVVDEYFRLRGRAEAERTQRIIELLEEERGRRAGEVNRLRENVRALAKQATGKDPFAVQPESEGRVQPPLADLQARLISAEVEAEILEAQIRALEKLIQQSGDADAEGVDENADVEGQGTKADAGGDRRRPNRPTRPTLSPYFDLYRGKEGLGDTVPEQPDVRDWIVQDKTAFSEHVRKLINRKRLELFEAEIASGTEGNELLVTRLKEQIQKMELGLAKLCDELQAEIKAQIKRGTLKERKQQLADMRSELEAQRMMEELLRERCHSQFMQLEQGSGETIELEFARDELARAKGVFDRIANRIITLRTEQRAPARVTQQLRAAVPTEPVERPYRTMATVSLGGFCLPFVLMGLWIGITRLKAWRKTP